MHLGVILPQTEIGSEPQALCEFALAAQEAGFEYLVVYDHVVGADTTDRPDWPGPYDVSSSFHEPFVLFGYLAGVVSMELMTGILILPQRQAVLVAKQAAEVDLLSGGRLRLGVGTGWNQVEYEALGAKWGTRAARYEEQIEVMRLLWSEEVVDFEGRFHRIDRAGILPRPVQRPIPIWMGGGTSEAVLERVGRLSDGWIPLVAPGRGLEEAIEKVLAAASEAGRPDGAVGIQGIVQPGEDPGEERLRRHLQLWKAAGATHVSVSGLGAGRSPSDHVEYIRRAGAALIG